MSRFVFICMHKNENIIDNITYTLYVYNYLYIYAIGTNRNIMYNIYFVSQLFVS